MWGVVSVPSYLIGLCQWNSCLPGASYLSCKYRAQQDASSSFGKTGCHGDERTRSIELPRHSFCTLQQTIDSRGLWSGSRMGPGFSSGLQPRFDPKRTPIQIMSWGRADIAESWPWLCLLTLWDGFRAAVRQRLLRNSSFPRLLPFAKMPACYWTWALVSRAAET